MDPRRAAPDEPVTFRTVATGREDPVVHAWWDFTGTGSVAATGVESATSFPLEKTYNVSLAVEDRAGRRRLVSVQVPVGRAMGRDITVDDTRAELFGRWGPYVPDTYTGPFARRDVVLRGKTMPARARFATTLPRSGRYQVGLGFLPEAHQATKAAVKIRHAGGLAQATVDQRTGEGPFPFPFPVAGDGRAPAENVELRAHRSPNPRSRLSASVLRCCPVGARFGSGVLDPVCTPLAPRRSAFCALNPSGSRIDGNHDGLRKLRRVVGNFLGLEWWKFLAPAASRLGYRVRSRGQGRRLIEVDRLRGGLSRHARLPLLVLILTLILIVIVLLLVVGLQDLDQVPPRPVVSQTDLGLTARHAAGRIVFEDRRALELLEQGRLVDFPANAAVRAHAGEPAPPGPA